MRRLVKISLAAIFILSGVWIMQKVGMVPSVKDLFSPQAVVIDQTPIIIKDIKSIAQLITIVAYDEVVVDSVIVDDRPKLRTFLSPFTPYPILPVINKKIVLIGRGKVLAGIDLSNLNEGDIKVDSDTITLIIERARILDAIINPSEFETFDEKGEWSDQEVTIIKMRARQKMIDRALQHNILNKADVKAKAVMENFLLASGYKKVNVVMK